LNSCAFALKPHCLVENNYLIRAILWIKYINIFCYVFFI
jgi:hypothetical protein